jgi:tetratricopeptide (TPR) repeat protein
VSSLRLIVTTLLLAGVLCCAEIAPEIDTTGMEPPVRELIQTRRAELNAAPAAETWGALGDTLLAHGLETEAAGCYERAVELSDEPFEWLYLQALATGGSVTETEAAIDLLQLALGLQPNHALAELRLALLHQQLARHEDAARWFALAARHDPSLQRALRGLGQTWLALGRYEAAIDALELALAGDPKDAAAWSAVAQAYAAGGQDARARTAAQRAKRSRERSGFHDEVWRRHVQQNGVSASRRFERAQYALAAGDPAIAREHVEAILRIRPEDADAHYLLGSIEAASGNQREAELCFEQALESNSGHVRALLDWASLAERSGRLDEARDLIERARALTPEDPSIVLALAQNRQRAVDLDGALEAYERLAQLTPDLAEVHRLLGQAYERTRKNGLAIKAYRRAVALDPASPAAARLEALER